MRSIFVIIFLFAFSAYAEKPCNDFVSQVLKENRYGTFDRPAGIVKTHSELAVTFGNPVGPSKKDNFRIKIIKSDGSTIIETVNAFGHIDQRTIQFNDRCKIEKITQEDAVGNTAVVNPNFCKNYENRKSKITDSDYTNPSKEFLAGASFSCSKPIAGFKICDDYSGHFSGQFYSPPPDKFGKCKSPRKISADGKSCVPVLCPPGNIFVDDEWGGTCQLPKSDSKSTTTTKQNR